MNKDQIKGRAKNLAGKTQEGAGKLTDNDSQRGKGLGKQVAGQVQESFGNAKESIRNATKKTH